MCSRALRTIPSNDSKSYSRTAGPRLPPKYRSLLKPLVPRLSSGVHRTHTLIGRIQTTSVFRSRRGLPDAYVNDFRFQIKTGSAGRLRIGRVLHSSASRRFAGLAQSSERPLGLPVWFFGPYGV